MWSLHTRQGLRKVNSREEAWSFESSRVKLTTHSFNEVSFPSVLLSVVLSYDTRTSICNPRKLVWFLLRKSRSFYREKFNIGSAEINLFAWQWRWRSVDGDEESICRFVVCDRVVEREICIHDIGLSGKQTFNLHHRHLLVLCANYSRRVRILLHS